MKTLKVTQYRGVRIYVRHLYRETFEYLVPLYGEIFCNQVEIKKTMGQRMRPFTEEEFKNAVIFMAKTAEMFIDDKKFEREQRSVTGKTINFIKTLNGKSKSEVRV